MIIRLGVKLSALTSSNRFITLITRLSVIGIMLGVATLLTVIAVMRGFENEIRRSLVSEFDHLHVHALFEHYPETLYDEILAIDGVKHVQGYQQTYGLIKTISQFVPVMIISFDAESGVSDPMSGQALFPESGSINLSDSPQFDYELGDVIAIITPNKSASVKKTNLNYAGDLSKLDIKSRGALTAVVDKDTFQEMTGTQILSGLSVVVNDIYMTKKVTHYLGKQYGGLYHTFDWRDRFKPFFNALRIQQSAMVLVLSLITLVAMFGLVSGLVMLASERRNDIALLKTMGASRRDIMTIFLTQGAMICGIGTTLGALLAVMLCYFAADIAGLLETLVGTQLVDPRVYGTSSLPTDLSVSLVFQVISITMLIGVLACSFPARRAAKVHPAEVLRYG